MLQIKTRFGIFKIFSLIFLLTLASLSVNGKTKKLKPGHWHTEFQLNNKTNLPVTFLLDKEKRLGHLYIINADEVIKLNEVEYQNDSVFINFSTFDSELRFKIIKKSYISGVWINHAKKAYYAIPFWSSNNGAPRFNQLPSNINVIGKWEVTFNYKENPEKALGIFEVNDFGCSYRSNNDIKGTFLTETGDYRYLEGAVSSDSLYLSTFDGSHAFLFKSKLMNDTLWGEFYSGKHYKTEWFAVRNESFELQDPDSLTYLVNNQPISFELMGLDRQMYKYPNHETKGKVTLIQILGTWCPNCLDESNYLVGLKEKYGNKLEIISIAFETQKTIEDKIAKIDKYKMVLGLDWTFLIGGDACKSCAQELFPMLNDISSFPTLIFIDKKGEIQRIHTGFSGPGTGEYYAEFVRETNDFVDRLIQE